MQNANIKYKIRLEGLVNEVEITKALSEFETDWTIIDSLEELGYQFSPYWDGKTFTVIERTIELFNED